MLAQEVGIMPNILDYDIQAVEDEYNGCLERQAEYQAELDLEDYLIEAWEAMQPKVEQDSELASVFMPILPGSQEVPF